MICETPSGAAMPCSCKTSIAINSSRPTPNSPTPTPAIRRSDAQRIAKNQGGHHGHLFVRNAFSARFIRFDAAANNCDPPLRSRRSVSTWIVWARSNRLAADAMAAALRSLPPPPILFRIIIAARCTMRARHLDRESTFQTLIRPRPPGRQRCPLPTGDGKRRQSANVAAVKTTPMNGAPTHENKMSQAGA
jgi:hypothetical protein